MRRLLIIALLLLSLGATGCGRDADREDATAVADSVRLAASWVRDSASDLVDGDPEVTVGEVRVRAESD